jgi:hypothetical protein
MYCTISNDDFVLQNEDGSYNFDQESVVNPETNEKVATEGSSSTFIALWICVDISPRELQICSYMNYILCKKAKVQGCMLCALSTSIPFTTVCAYVPRK